MSSMGPSFLRLSFKAYHPAAGACLTALLFKFALKLLDCVFGGFQVFLVPPFLFFDSCARREGVLGVVGEAGALALRLMHERRGIRTGLAAGYFAHCRRGRRN